MMKAKYILLVFALLIGKVNAQQTITGNTNVIPGLPNLKIGDPLPDFEISKIINSDKRTARSSDFKDQLLIVDFWSTTCSGCVAGLPNMEALQKQFGTKVKIMPVSYEKEANVLLFWKNNKYTKKLSLPSVVDDKVFESYFRHKGIPHEVWVYKGIVVGITGPEYVDANNIQKVLSGQQINWPVKDDFYVFDASKPLFNSDTNQVNPKSTRMKYAAISDYKAGAPISGLQIIRDSVKKMARCYSLNSSVFSTYLLSWLQLTRNIALVKPSASLDSNQIVWEVADKNKYWYNPKAYKAEWFVKNSICFESVNPDIGQTDLEIYQSVIADLNSLLGLNVRWEKRKEQVLVLVRTTTEDKLKTKKPIGWDRLGYDLAERYVQKGNLHQFRDLTLYAVLHKINGESSNPYVFDETNYKENIDMDLNIPSWTDIAAIRKSIQPYGLDLKEEERTVDKFVFTEASYRKQ